MESHLEMELDALKQRLLKMASHAEAAVGLALQALTQRDDDLALQVKEAQTCYAWRHTDGHGTKIFTVLGNQVVSSAQRAIQAAIFVDVQPPAPKFANRFIS
jgi:phosphate uptake regulator